MSTILSDAKEFYPDFFNRGHKDVQSACELLKYKRELDKRLEYIYRVYKFLLNEEKMNKVTVEWIKNNKFIIRKSVCACSSFLITNDQQQQ